MSLRTRNLEVAFNWIDALRRQDIAQLTDLLDPAACWWAVGQTLDQSPGCGSRDEIAAMLRRGFSRQATAAVEALELAASDDHVLIGRRNPELIELNGVPLYGQEFIVLTVAQGTITTLRSYAGRAEARQAAGLSDADDWR
jgi:ketosteroid isomerase-like protein